MCVTKKNPPNPQNYACAALYRGGYLATFDGITPPTWDNTQVKAKAKTEKKIIDKSETPPAEGGSKKGK